MKKLLSLLLTLAMVASLTTNAFAADQEGVVAGSYGKDVTGIGVAGTNGYGTIFSVDISWTNMSFTYHAAKEPVWEPESHSYSELVAAYWEGEGTIEVTNHSNVRISVTPAYTPAEGYSATSMNFDTNLLSVASAEIGQAQTGAIVVTPSGSLPAMEEAETIGRITVTIDKDPNVAKEDVEVLQAMYTQFYEEGLSFKASDKWANDHNLLDITDEVTARKRDVTNLLTEWENVPQEQKNTDYERFQTTYRNCLAAFNAWKEANDIEA